MNIIACVDNNWGIGNDGKLLFSIQQDMEFFRFMTINNIVVMGKKTFDTLRTKPLPNRINVVLTRDTDFKPEGAEVCHSVEEALDFLRDRQENVFIIGGEEIYKTFLPYCNKAYITKVFTEKKADKHMVNLDSEADWTQTQTTKDFTHGEVSYSFTVYEKVMN